MKLTVRSDLPVATYEKKWQFCVGSCHAATLLRKDAIEILKRVHDELGIKRVRFHGTFNDDMGTLCNFKSIFGVPVGTHIQETDFHKIGVLYDNILSIGMQPFVEISFMPELLASDKKRSFLYGSIHSMPEDWNRWYAYIQEYLRYLFHRYGEEEIKQWFFEVWNEPDLQGMFFDGTQDGYMQLYEMTARAIKDFCPDLSVGGPASAMSRWIPEFLNYCREHDVPVDFVTTHQYCGEPFIGVSGRDKDEEEKQEQPAQLAVKERFAVLDAALSKLPPDTPLLKAFSLITGGQDLTQQPWDPDLLKKNAAVVRQQAKGLPVYYTEWNLSSHFGVPSQDSRKVAAYQVRTSLSIEDLTEGNSIWCFSDIFEELHQFKEPFHGGYGLITYDGIPKPQFFAMRMLAQAESKQILLDESEFTEIRAAAFEGEKEKQILLFRQNTMQSDAPAEEAEITVELAEAPKRVYLQRIDEAHCNPRRVWEQMGSPNDLNAAEIAEIKAGSDMVDEKIPYTYEDGLLKTTAALGINDIWFIRIEK